MTEQEIKNRNKMLYREGMFSPAEKKKALFIFHSQRSGLAHGSGFFKSHPVVPMVTG